MDVTQIWVVYCSPGISCDLTTPRIWPSNVNNTTSSTATTQQPVSGLVNLLNQVNYALDLTIQRAPTPAEYENWFQFILDTSLFRNPWQGWLHKLKVMETNKAVQGHGVASCQQLTRFSPAQTMWLSAVLWLYKLNTASTPFIFSFIGFRYMKR